MSSMNQSPSSERVHITIFGRRNSGKSSLINALTNQRLAIVSEVAGTTTDPVSKAMEILPLGPVVVTDTAGIDDAGDLGRMRVEKTLRVLEKTDIAVLVVESGQVPGEYEEDLLARIKKRELPVVVCASKIDAVPDFTQIRQWATRSSALFLPVSAETGEGVRELREELGQISPRGEEPVILRDLIDPGDIVVLVIPIDSAAPKGRVILPQVMALREVLDSSAIAVSSKESELKMSLEALVRKPKLVVTDSQAFAQVSVETPLDVQLTSFSILMARYRGDLAALVRGSRAMDYLKPGNRVLISEGCTHHQQSDDIGRVKIPRLLQKSVGAELQFGFSSGRDFPEDVADYDLIVHCGGCMINPREMRYRQRVAAEAGVPMTNYGVLLAKLNGILTRALSPIPGMRAVLEETPE